MYSLEHVCSISNEFGELMDNSMQIRPEVCTVYWKGGARVKRDLVQREKRPTISAKETYLADLRYAKKKKVSKKVSIGK